MYNKFYERRKELFLGISVDTFLSEARTLGISTDVLIKIIKERTKND